jgi:lipopolysaccharide/colanic/teichoic acid biosynthesis glycosyltransferase
MSPVTLTSSSQSKLIQNPSGQPKASQPKASQPKASQPKVSQPQAVSTRLPAPSVDGSPEPTQAAAAPELVVPDFLLTTVHPSVRSLGKRVLDIVGAIVGLGLTALLFIPIAIAIQLDNPGPVLYCQERCSVAGKRFRIWKFRSMVTNADALKQSLQNEAAGQIFKIADDPRITKVGKFLRRTSLDEFPQFWNVLVGDMSLVGTRPPSLDEVSQYELHHWQRLAVKPGITGVWQVNGRSAVKDFEDIVKLDLSYQADWSLRYDLYLIFKTVWVVFNKDGAC